MDTLLDVLRKGDGSVPPDAVRSACRRGLELAPEYGGDGLTEGAKARARSMAGGGPVSSENIGRMVNFFGRHQQNRADPSAKEPTPGAVAWLLWGGDAGKRWAESQHQSDDDVEKAGKGKNGLIGGIGARQWAEKEAKRKGKPKAYANAIFAKLTHKSERAGVTMQSPSMYTQILTKSGGEGTRGGSIIGHTKSGRPIYNASSRHNRAIVHASGGPSGKNVDKGGAAALKAHPTYTADDHMDAASAHQKKAMKSHDIHDTVGDAHRKAISIMNIQDNDKHR